jgi:protein gp37
MASKTGIQWTDATWSPIRARVKVDAADIAAVHGWLDLREICLKMAGHVGPHCEFVSSGCNHCYSCSNNHRCLPSNGTGLPFDKRSRELVDIFVDEKILLQPLKWRTPKKIFVENQSDLFGEWVPFEMIDRVFAVMALCPQHTFQVLTKRPERMREYMLNTDRDSPVGRMESYARSLGMPWKDIPSPDWPLKNVWLGVSCENQQTADERIPLLLETPAAVRFVSYEPAIGPVDFQRTLWNHVTEHAALRFAKEVDGKTVSLKPIFGLDWVIVGGESGAKARPFEVDWARRVVGQCKAANVACFVKQMGSNAQERNDRIADVWYYAEGSDMDTEAVDGDSYRYQGMPVRLRLKDGHGGDPNEWAEDLRVRQFPAQQTS